MPMRPIAERHIKERPLNDQGLVDLRKLWTTPQHKKGAPTKCCDARRLLLEQPDKPYIHIAYQLRDMGYRLDDLQELRFLVTHMKNDLRFMRDSIDPEQYDEITELLRKGRRPYGGFKREPKV